MNMPAMLCIPIPIVVNIEPRRVLDLVITACEQGSGYWARWHDVDRVDVPAWVESYERDYAAPLCGGAIRFVEIGDDGFAPLEPQPEQLRTLDRSTVRNGLALMARLHARHFGDFVSGNADAETADVFLQLALLGEVKYG